MSAYSKALEFLKDEFWALYNEGYMNSNGYNESIEGLKELSAAEVMQMYKEWKDCE